LACKLGRSLYLFKTLPGGKPMQNKKEEDKKRKCGFMHFKTIEDEFTGMEFPFIEFCFDLAGKRFRGLVIGVGTVFKIDGEKVSLPVFYTELEKVIPQAKPEEQKDLKELVKNLKRLEKELKNLGVEV
jgi:hypothetical protein